VAPLDQRLRRVETPRLAAAGLGLAFLLLLAAYAYLLTISAATTSGLLAAGAAVLIAGSGIAYAWRAVTGAVDE
jgi:hypothetical protein